MSVSVLHGSSGLNKGKGELELKGRKKKFPWELKIFFEKKSSSMEYKESGVVVSLRRRYISLHRLLHMREKEISPV